MESLGDPWERLRRVGMPQEPTRLIEINSVDL